MARWRPFVQGDSYMANKKWTPLVIGNGYTTTDGASGPAPEYETVTGNPVSFNAITPFPLKQLSVAFSPVQDLHGYDSPWPAGGGKNKLSISPSIVTKTQYGVTFTINRNSAGDVTSIVANGTSTTRNYFSLGRYGISGGTVLNGCPAGGAYGTYSLGIDGTTVSDTGNGATIESDMTNAALQIVIARDYVCNNLTFKPMIRLSSVSDATFAPYSNICPILGWDSLTVEQRGKNLADDTDLKTSPYNIYNCPNPLKNSTQYTYSVFGTTSNGFRLMAAHANTATPTPNIGVSTGYISSGNHNTFTTPADIEDYEYIYFAGNASGAGQSDASFVVTLGDSVPTAYTPYNPSSRSISIALGQTVYSGTVDVVSGIGVSERGTKTFSGSDSDAIVLVNTYNGTTVKHMVFGFDIIDLKTGNPNYMSDLMCNQAIPAYVADGTADERWTFRRRSGTPQLIVFAPTSMGVISLNDFKAMVANVPFTFIYDKRVADSIQLTPQEVESLAGDNTMWTDAASLEVTYRSN